MTMSGRRMWTLGLLLVAARSAGALRRREADKLEADLLATSDSEQGTEGWEACATEGDAVLRGGLVRFGWGFAWAEKELPAGAACTIGSFGADPAPNLRKVCECSGDGPDSRQSRTEMGVAWSRCADEGSDCACAGGTVRFGEGSRWLVATEAGSPKAGPVPCATGNFGGDPSPGAHKECWCMQGNSVPPKAKVAIVLLTRHAADLKTWLRYHLDYMGVDRVFMEVEDSPELSATLAAAPPAWRSKITTWWATPPPKGQDRRPADDYETLQKRQVAAMTAAKRQCEVEGIDWLLHIDDDELLYTPQHRPLGSVLAAMPIEFNQAYIPNVEAVYPSADTESCFKDAVEFNVNRYKFAAYANGKAAVRVADTQAHPAGPHQWRDANNEEPPSIHLDAEPFGPPLMVVHFESCPFARWEDKFYELGNTDEEKVSHIPFPFYRESIEKMQQCRVESQGDALLQATSRHNHAYSLDPDCSEPALKQFWSQWKTEANPKLRKTDLMPLQIPWSMFASG
mmetsp:Transcript_615/g.1735  ORF Transcript_615/g.1735 Transcript_615/m.1735 type:complete len:512 (-) Transcript_615:101-1636(-)